METSAEFVRYGRRRYTKEFLFVHSVVTRRTFYKAECAQESKSFGSISRTTFSGSLPPQHGAFSVLERNRQLPIWRVPESMSRTADMYWFCNWKVSNGLT